MFDTVVGDYMNTVKTTFYLSFFIVYKLFIELQVYKYEKRNCFKSTASLCLHVCFLKA